MSELPPRPPGAKHHASSSGRDGGPIGARKQEKEKSTARTATDGKVFPPDSPVDVPRQPEPAQQASSSDDGTGKLPDHDPRTASSWADNTEPAPHKTNARSSIFS